MPENKNKPNLNKKPLLAGGFGTFAKTRQEAETMEDWKKNNPQEVAKEKKLLSTIPDSRLEQANKKRAEIYQSGPKKGQPTGKGALEPSYPELMLMPGNLPIKAASKIGKAAVGVAEALNPIGGMKSLKPTSISSSVDDVGRNFKSELDWRNWVKYKEDFDNNPQVIQELINIEKQSKAANTWMKNPDGSSFQGSPEQFVVQQSSRFKKAFGNSKLLNPDGSPKIIKHGSEKNNIEIFKSPSQQENFKKRTATTKDTEHIFFTPDDYWANSFARKESLYKDGKVYDVYANVENPLITSIPEEMYNPEIIPNFRDYDAVTNLKLGEKDTRPFREIAIPNWNYTKSAVGNILFDMSNPNIYKSIAPYTIPAAIGAGALQENKEQPKQKLSKGGSISKFGIMDKFNEIFKSEYSKGGYNLDKKASKLKDSFKPKFHTVDKNVPKSKSTDFEMYMRNYQNGGRLMPTSDRPIFDLKYADGGKIKKLDPLEEKEFLKEYSKYSKLTGMSPNPDDPEHYYDYRGLWKDTGTILYNLDKDQHLPSKYKTLGHPNKYIQGVDTTKEEYAKGGEIDNNIDVTKAKEYAMGWYNSPMYKSILTEQYGERTAKNKTKQANYFSDYYDVNPTLKSDLKPYGKNIPKGNKRDILLKTKFVQDNPTLVNSLFAHELFHDEMITDKDKQKIVLNTPEKELNNYIANPEEVRSQIHAIRQLGQENKVYDPFTQKFEKDYLQKIDTLFNQAKDADKNYNQLQRLRKIYTDDQIIDMMNTISKTNSNDKATYARFGGKIKKSNGGWLDNIQLGLDAAQFIPAIGEVAYLASLPFTTYDVAKELYKGNYKQAGVDALGYIPGLKAYKYGVKTGSKVLDTTSKLAKQYKKVNNVVNTTNLINDVNKKENIPSKTKEVKKIKQ